MRTSSRRVRITHPHGLHLRLCLAIVNAVNRHQAKVTVHKDGQAESASSILGLLSLAAASGSELVLSASGLEAEQALQAVAGCLTDELALA